MNQRPVPFLTAIVGGSGSGKTWLADRLQAALRPGAERISLDDFYSDQSHIPEAERGAINFDDPAIIDWPALENVLRELLAGRTAQLPCYDFKTHCRSAPQRTVQPKPVLIVEGLWLLHRVALREMFDLKVFIDCPPPTRLRRRIERDLLARGRSRASVERQFEETVEPMHRKFVTPQKRWADVVLPHDLSEYDVRQLAEKLAAKLPNLRP